MIKSAPGYFQEIMEQLTSDLLGAAVYLDDILVSGTSAEDHMDNLRRLNGEMQVCRTKSGILGTLPDRNRGV